MIAKTIARKTGLYPSSNGHLIKTDLAGCLLGVCWLTTRVLGHRPQRIANRLSSRRTRPAYRWNLNAAIDHCALELCRGALWSGFFHCSRHDAQYGTFG